MALPQVSPGLLPAENYRRFNVAFAALDGAISALQAVATQAADAATDIVDLQRLTASHQDTLEANVANIQDLFERLASTSQSLTDTRNAYEVFAKYASDAINLLDGRIDYYDREAALKVDVQDLSSSLSDFKTSIRAITDDLTKRLASVTALQATQIAALEARRFEWLSAGSRPGEQPAGYVFTSQIASLGARRAALPPLDQSAIAIGDQGTVFRITGSGKVATRAAFPVELGRVGRVRAAVQRRANPSDPAGDAVRVLLVWLGQSGGLLGGSQAYTVVKSFDQLQTGVGRQAVEVLFTRAPSPGMGMVQAPAAARSVLAVVETFGPDGGTDIEVLGIDDVTAATVLDPVSSDIAARVGAVESVDPGSRLDAVEARLNAPNSVTYATMADAAAATIPASVTTVETRGRASAGDGAGGLYRKISGALGAGDDGFSSGGVSYRRVTASQAAFNADYGALLAGFYDSLPRTPPDAGGLWLNNGVVELAARAP